MNSRFFLSNVVRIFLFFFSLTLIWSCSGQRHLVKSVKNLVEQSDTLNKYQVGFALYDPDKSTYLYSKDLHKYYTPASNTKIYTLYAALNMLPEQVSALRYVSKGDSLIFWGTGDPSFLQGKLKGQEAYNFLKNANQKLFYAPTRYTSHFYGAGWQWDDYNDYYQPEINDLPIMDNMVTIKSQGDQLYITPKTLAANFRVDSSSKAAFRAVRAFDHNTFVVPPTAPVKNYLQQVPYKLSPQLTIQLLRDTLHKEIGLINMEMPQGALRLPGMARDSILKEMMQPSDNFIAEHLLLLGADQLGKELNTQKTISYVLGKYLSDLTDKPIWVDGSGLSRYNLVTPAANVQVLDKLLKMYPDRAQLFQFFPAGGYSGTLKNTYPQTETPFVFAKTGTVSNTHNQSGYIRTKSGKVLIYAFLNNNFVFPTAEIRKQMVKIVTFIHENY